MSQNRTDCIFCDIIRGAAPAEVVFENEHVVCILDAKPLNYGHTLVIPRQHCTNFLDLPESEYAEVLKAAHIVAKALVEEYGIEGFHLFSNNGRTAGQTVFHFHIHVTPRHADDNIRFVLDLKRYAGDDFAQVGLRLRQRVHHLLHS